MFCYSTKGIGPKTFPAHHTCGNKAEQLCGQNKHALPWDIYYVDRITFVYKNVFILSTKWKVHSAFFSTKWKAQSVIRFVLCAWKNVLLSIFNAFKRVCVFHGQKAFSVTWFPDKWMPAVAQNALCVTKQGLFHLLPQNSGLVTGRCSEWTKQCYYPWQWRQRIRCWKDKLNRLLHSTQSCHIENELRNTG